MMMTMMVQWIIIHHFHNLQSTGVAGVADDVHLISKTMIHLRMMNVV